MDVLVRDWATLPGQYVSDTSRHWLVLARVYAGAVPIVITVLMYVVFVLAWVVPGQYHKVRVGRAEAPLRRTAIIISAWRYAEAPLFSARRWFWPWKRGGDAAEPMCMNLAGAVLRWYTC